MTHWQEIVEHVVAGRPHMSYAAHGTPSGPSGALRWHSTLVVAERESSSCVAATFEVLLLAMQQCPALVEALDVKAIKQLFARTYIVRTDEGWESGVAGGLVEAGVADFVEWDDARSGDFAQVQWNATESPWSGHAVVLLSAPMESPKGGGSVVWDFSANVGRPAFLPPASVFANYRPGWLQSRLPGTQVDYHSRVKPGRDRRWHIARLKAEFVG